MSNSISKWTRRLLLVGLVLSLATVQTVFSQHEGHNMPGMSKPAIAVCKAASFASANSHEYAWNANAITTGLACCFTSDGNAYSNAHGVAIGFATQDEHDNAYAFGQSCDQRQISNQATGADGTHEHERAWQKLNRRT